MTFLSPLALLALLPWGAVAWRMLRARAEARRVPFLALWPRTSVSAPRRGRRLPPAFVWLSLLGMLLAILAAGRPSVTAFGLGEYRISVLLDRGATMSAGADEQTRLARFLAEHADLLEALGQGAAVRAVPEDETLPGDAPADWSQVEPTPSAAQTGRLLTSAIRRERSDGRGVLVITDQPLALNDTGVFRIGPTTAPPDVALTALATDGRAVLVSVHNASDTRQAQLTITAGDHTVRQAIDLPPRGETAQVEVAVVPPEAAPVDGFTAELVARENAWPGNDRLSIARTRPWPRIDAHPTLPAPIQRFANTFTRLRSPRPHSQTLLISPSPLPPNQPGIILPHATGPAAFPTTAPVPSPNALPFTTALTLGNPTPLAPYPFPNDPAWTPILTQGPTTPTNTTVLLAIRTTPVRQVWIGFTDPAWEQTPDFVRFWTDLLLWLNGGPEEWSANTVPPEDLRQVPLDEAVERIGLQPTPTGPVAWNLPPVTFPDPRAWSREELDNWLEQHRRGREIGGGLIVAALLALTAAAWMWPRSYGTQSGGAVVGGKVR